ncbi:MAG: sterol desaturase family protein [Crocinitomicaceae bacterium]
MNVLIFGKMSTNSISYKLIQYSFYPFVISVTLISSFLYTDYFHRDNYIFIPGNVSLMFLAFFIFGERFFPYRKDWYGNKGDLGTDAVQTFVVLPLASKLSELAVPFLFYYPIIWASQTIGYFDFTTEWGMAGHFALALVACELFYYWFHRLSHNWSLLWRFHAVHHGAERVYWVNSGRFHFIESFFSSMIYFLPLIFIGTTPEVTVLVLTFSSITGFLEHINIDFKAGILNYVFNTAQHHRWHHSRVIKESNKNYGKALIIWDVIFGTFFLPKEREVEEVGIIGRPVSNKLSGQLLYPFQKDDPPN